MSSIVYQSKSDALAAELNWSFLPNDGSAKSSKALIRSQAALIGADRYCLNALDDASYIGLYSEPVLLEGKKPKRLHSLALTFLNAMGGRSTTNAILLMTSPQNDARRILVVIEGGQIVWDRIDSIDAVTKKVQEYRSSGIGYEAFSDSLDVSGAKEISFEQLFGYADKSSELNQLPRNYTILIGLSALVLLASAYGFYHYTVVAPAKARAKLLAQQAAQNTTPQYLQLLGAESLRAGWARADIEAAIKDFATQKTYAKGWILTQVLCDFPSSSCKYKFDRNGGEVSELITIEGDKTQNAETSTKDVANFSKVIKPVAMKLVADNLPKQLVSNVEALTKAQRLLNAGSQVNTTAPTPWPTAGIDMTKVDASVIVKRSAFEIKAPYPLASSVLSQLPENHILQSFALDVSVGGDKAELLKLTLKGHSYAK